MQGSDEAGRAGELDGFDLTIDDNVDEFSDPVIANATWIGSGASSTATTDAAMRFRAGGAGEFYNSIFTDFPNDAVRIDDDDSSIDRFNAGDLNLKNNVFFGFGAGNTIPEIVRETFADSQLEADNTFQDPQLGGISRTNNGGLDPRAGASLPSPLPKGQFVNSSAAGSADYPGVTLADIQNVNYLGAFAPAAALWTDGWTALSQNGYTP